MGGNGVRKRKQRFLTPGLPLNTVVCCVTCVGFKDKPSVERMIGPIDCPVLESDKEIAGILPA